MTNLNVPRRSVAVALVTTGLAIALSLVSITKAAPTPRMINLSGKTISSVYAGEAPRRGYSFAVNSAGGHSHPPTCPQSKDAVYHPDDPVQLQKVQTCGGQYFDQMYRSCGSSCGGGSELWTFSSTHVPCDQGWEIIPSGGCKTNCRQEEVCDNPCD